MTLPSEKNGNLAPKREGTTQTYGQLVLIPALGEEGTSISNKDNANSTIAPQDTIVKIVATERGDLLNVTQLSDKDKSKIALAAVSDHKDPIIAIEARDLSDEAVLEGSSFNSSRVKPNEIGSAIVIGSSYKAKEDIKKILQEASKLDLTITLRSQESEEIEFNNLKEAELTAEFNYNFFTPEERDIKSEEDPALDPLLKNNIFNVPRYVELKWTPSKVTEKLSREETIGNQLELKELRREIFDKYRGKVNESFANYKDSFERSKKRLNLITQDGIKREITDMHRLDVAFGATANKNIFSNTIGAVVNKQDKKNDVNSLPVNLRGAASSIKNAASNHAKNLNSSLNKQRQAQSKAQHDYHEDAKIPASATKIYF